MRSREWVAGQGEKGRTTAGDRKSSSSDCEITKNYGRSSWGRRQGSRSNVLKK